MSDIEITKMSAAGNDFILLDTQKYSLPDPPESFIRRICSRRISIGADGFLTLDRSKLAHIKVTYFNSDGSRANLCLNGTRCAAMYAFRNVLAPRKMKIETEAGTFRAEIIQGGVRVQLPPSARKITHLDLDLDGKPWPGFLVDVGVPHLILLAGEDLSSIDFVPLARMLRYHPLLEPEGANVSMVHIVDENLVRIRTYERGIEDEMLSCSSGSWAAVLALLLSGSRLCSPVQILPQCLIPLNFSFEWRKGNLESMELSGEARFIFQARIQPEAWSWGA